MMYKDDKEVEMKTIYSYSDYNEIPEIIETYILSVSDMKALEHLPLQDINSFLNGLEEYSAIQDAEFMSNPENIEQMFLDMNGG